VPIGVIGASRWRSRASNRKNATPPGPGRAVRFLPLWPLLEVRATTTFKFDTKMNVPALADEFAGEYRRSRFHLRHNDGRHDPRPQPGLC
jgi:hypothetical protein